METEVSALSFVVVLFLLVFCCLFLFVCCCCFFFFFVVVVVVFVCLFFLSFFFFFFEYSVVLWRSFFCVLDALLLPSEFISNISHTIMFSPTKS